MTVTADGASGTRGGVVIAGEFTQPEAPDEFTERTRHWYFVLGVRLDPVYEDVVADRFEVPPQVPFTARWISTREYGADEVGLLVHLTVMDVLEPKEAVTLAGAAGDEYGRCPVVIDAVSVAVPEIALTPVRDTETEVVLDPVYDVDTE